MTAPKPGDLLTAEQARALPDGAVVAQHRTITTNGDDLSPDVAALGILRYDRAVTLVSLPTPPDMAPGSVVLDEDGRAWVPNPEVQAWLIAVRDHIAGEES